MQRSPLKPSQAALLEQMQTSGVNLATLPDEQVRAAIDQMASTPTATGEIVAVHSAENRSIPGPEPDSELQLWIYSPHPPSQHPGPVLLHLHGGGWNAGSLMAYDNFCRRLALATDAKVVAVDYRLAPEAKFPAGLEDCYAALVWVHGAAGELGIDPALIFVGGDSAGGNLTAAVTLLIRERSGPRLAGQFLIYPVTGDDDPSKSLPSRWAFGPGEALAGNADMDRCFRLYLSESQSELSNPLVAPLNAPDLSGLPPALIHTAEHDLLLDDGKQYAGRLRDAGVKVAYREFPGVLHGFALFFGSEHETQELIEDIAGFVKDIASKK